MDGEYLGARNQICSSPMKLFNRNNLEHPGPKHHLDFGWMKWAHDRLKAFLKLQVVNGSSTTPSIQIAQGNVTIVLPKPSEGNALSAFAITELGHQDYVVARELSNMRLVDGVATADIGSADIKIAKVKNVRRSITSQLLYSDTINYSDDDVTDTDNTRIANNGTDPDEHQVCLPPYMTLTDLGLSGTVPANAECVIYAKKVPGITGVFDEDGKALEWLEDCGSDSVRTFAKRNT